MLSGFCPFASLDVAASCAAWRAFGELDLIPNIEHAVRITRLRFAEHMRMTTDDLRVDRAAHIIDSELAPVGCDLALQDYLQQHIAQLFTEVLGIVRFDRIVAS